ncbi:hypothetical protein KOR42_41020 [Thalassoglobus neptunius]|uniref:DUF4185 domain-containing protein n=2 Tax=Thalassoglobus neptunius TaxID=1938619 RepID=A0A5C5WBB9_9PLAN|nr:hypothetical protein KOR42_41020 [Thalassoglobus neptunius]
MKMSRMKTLGVIALALLICEGLNRRIPAQQNSSRLPPYPKSNIIRDVRWAPMETVIRKAKGGDNWPVTWARDGSLYSTYGDGWGFEPKLEEKLSLGLVRIDGSPTDFSGVNLRSPTIEQRGQGRNGRKSWGILSVDGVLCLWLGHNNLQGGESTLAWSEDHGGTWSTVDWKFEEFGLMGFVNFGRDYQGARDEFVYAYSHDGPNADSPADHFVLMRAHKDHLLKRDAWEFFVRRDANQQPVWSKRIDERGPVFEHPDSCLRSAITFNPGLNRYLWWQAIPQPPGHPDRGDTRFEGGFGIYDAPEPWGPWTTVEFVPAWDIGPGEHGDFPTKWMSEDGRTLHLIFSGDDCFCVRKAVLVTQ